MYIISCCRGSGGIIIKSNFSSCVLLIQIASRKIKMDRDVYYGSGLCLVRDVYEYPPKSGEVIDSSSLLRSSANIVVAKSPLGGPVAVIERRAKNRLFLFTPSFRRIAEIDLSLKAPIVGAFWTINNSNNNSDDEPLLLQIITSDWNIRTVSIRPQHLFMPGFSTSIAASLPSKKQAPPLILAAAVFQQQVILMSESMEFFLITNLHSSPGPIIPLAPIPKSLAHCPVVSFAALPSGAALAALEGGALVLLQDSAAVILRGEETSGSTIILMALSYTGNHLATYSSTGLVETFSTASLNTLTPISSSQIDIGIAPSQIAWIGEDFQTVSFCSGSRNVVFVGAHDSWSPYEYESAVYVSSDLHWATVLSEFKFQIIQRSMMFETSSPACSRLISGFERFSANDVGAESIVRSLKPQLVEAAVACLETAGFQTPFCESNLQQQEKYVKKLLQSATFAHQFIPSPVRPSSLWVNVAALIRLCHALNLPELGIPVGVSQMASLGGKWTGEFFAKMLAARGEYPLAIRVAEWMDVSCTFVTNLWAFDLILSSDHLPDRDLCAIISHRLGNSRNNNCSLIKVAEFAFKYAGRKTLAITLLQFEADPKAQVKLLLALESADLAIQKALNSAQVDLIHTCFLQSSCSIRDLVTTKSSSLTNEELTLMLSLVQFRYYSQRKYEEFCKLLQTMPGCELLLADSSLRLVREKITETSNITKSLEVAEWIQYAAERFAESALAPRGPLPNSPAGCQSTAALLAESSQLLRAQVLLEKTAAAKGWAKGPHRFAGLPLNETLSKLLLLGEFQEAESLRTKRKISDGKFWEMRLRTSLLNGRLQEGVVFASNNAPPSADCRGYKAVVEILLNLKREDLALPFIKKLKPKKQTEIYTQLGLLEEARSVQQLSTATGLLTRLASGLIGR